MKENKTSNNLNEKENRPERVNNFIYYVNKIIIYFTPVILMTDLILDQLGNTFATISSQHMNNISLTAFNRASLGLPFLLKYH